MQSPGTAASQAAPLAHPAFIFKRSRFLPTLNLSVEEYEHLATGAVHSHLLRKGLRGYTSINVRSAECLDTHYFAVLIGVGATTVNAYLAQDCIADRHARGLFGQLPLGTCVKRYLDAVSAGLLKIISKMGISVISSYRGAYTFEAVGLSRSMVADIFPGMPSRISGIGLQGIAAKAARQHGRAFDEDVIALPIGGFYKARAGGETHGNSAPLIHLLQQAVANDSYATYRKYSDGVWATAPVSLRHLMALRAGGPDVPLEEVESITEIRKRFVTPGMSLGALSPEARAEPPARRPDPAAARAGGVERAGAPRAAVGGRRGPRPLPPRGAAPPVADGSAELVVPVAEDPRAHLDGVADDTLDRVAPAVELGRHLLDLDAGRWSVRPGQRHWARDLALTATRRRTVGTAP